MPSLEGVRAKLGRADEHLEALDKEARAFAEREPYKVVRDRDTREEWLSFRICVSEQPSLRLGLIFGDLLYNLRSALDNLAWQLVLLGGGTPGKHTQFPILDDPDKWKGGGLGPLKGVRPDHARLIEAAQPYPGRNQTRPQALFVVNQYGNIDKHQALHPIIVGMQREPPPLIRMGRDSIDTDTPIRFAFPSAGKPLHDGAEIMRVWGVGDADAKVQVQTELGFEIAFGEVLRVKALPTIRWEIGALVDEFAPDFGQP